MINKSYFLYRCIFLLFSMFIVSTFFLPTMSFDKYVEYEFNYGYENTDYIAYSQPFSSKISPYYIVSSLWTSKSKYKEITKNYNLKLQELYYDLNTGKITEEEYINLIANAKETNEFTIAQISIGDGDYSRLQSQLQTYAIITILFYVLFIVFFIINLINMFLNSRMLYMANYQTTWLIIGLWIINIILMFAFSISNNESMLYGQVVEIVTKCGAPTTLTYIVILSAIAYLVIAKVVCENFLDFSYFDDETTSKARKFRKSSYNQIEEYLNESGYKPKNFKG